MGGQVDVDMQKGSAERERERGGGKERTIKDFFFLVAPGKQNTCQPGSDAATREATHTHTRL